MYQSPCLREVLCVQKPHNRPARLRGHAGGRCCLPEVPYLRLFCERQEFCLSHGCRYIAGLLFLRYRPVSDGRGRCLWERCNSCPCKLSRCPCERDAARGFHKEQLELPYKASGVLCLTHWKFYHCFFHLAVWIILM